MSYDHLHVRALRRAALLLQPSSADQLVTYV